MANFSGWDHFNPCCDVLQHGLCCAHHNTPWCCRFPTTCGGSPRSRSLLDQGDSNRPNNPLDDSCSECSDAGDDAIDCRSIVSEDASPASACMVPGIPRPAAPLSAIPPSPLEMRVLGGRSPTTAESSVDAVSPLSTHLRRTHKAAMRLVTPASPALGDLGEHSPVCVTPHRLATTHCPSPADGSAGSRRSHRRSSGTNSDTNSPNTSVSSHQASANSPEAHAAARREATVDASKQQKTLHRCHSYAKPASPHIKPTHCAAAAAAVAAIRRADAASDCGGRPSADLPRWCYSTPEASDTVRGLSPLSLPITPSLRSPKPAARADEDREDHQLGGREAWVANATPLLVSSLELVLAHQRGRQLPPSPLQLQSERNAHGGELERILLPFR